MLPFLFFSGNAYLIEQFSQKFHRRPKAQPRDVVVDTPWIIHKVLDRDEDPSR
jgi:hypothetical protein